MITDRIKALFNFIEFLNSNIENFKQYDILINELNSLDDERNKLNPDNNFVDKIKYDEIQSEFKTKFKIIDDKIIQKLKDKSNEFNICDWNKTETLWNYNILEINELKVNFNENDISEILLHKNKYIEFRTKTKHTYFNYLFFKDLDRILKVIFDFFKDNNKNEFEAFEIKTIEVNSIQELFEKRNDKKTTTLNGLLYINHLYKEVENTLGNNDLSINEKQKLPIPSETIKPFEVKNIHPKHDPNLWNTNCFELFKYLFDEYYKGTKRQITNIWFYLKEYKSKSYTLNATKHLYTDFIKENYKISITNFDKAQQKWEDKEYKKIDEHRQNFEDGLK